MELEAFGGELDFERLPGLWRLLYTTAEDVVSCRALYVALSLLCRLRVIASRARKQMLTPSMQQPLPAAIKQPFLLLWS